MKRKSDRNTNLPSGQERLLANKDIRAKRLLKMLRFKDEEGAGAFEIDDFRTFFLSVLSTCLLPQPASSIFYDASRTRLTPHEHRGRDGSSL